MELDSRLEAGLASMRVQVILLEAVPGVERSSACAILVELGPDLSSFTGTAHVAGDSG